MNQFDIEKDTAKYSKEARLVVPAFAFSVVLTIGFFVVMMICYLTEHSFMNTAFALFCVCGVLAVVLSVFYAKNKHKYDLFTYFDAFPDMAAPLNIIALAWYKGRMETLLTEKGLTLLACGFSKMQQVCSLQIMAKDSEGVTISAEFYTSSVNIHNLDNTGFDMKKYDKFIDKQDDDQQKLNKMLDLFASATTLKAED